MTDIKRIRPAQRMSQAVVHGNTVYLAGQVAQRAPGASVAEQTKDILAGIEACLPSAANGPSAVVETGESRALGLPLPATATTLVTTVQAGTNEDRLGSFVLAFPVSLARHLWPGAAPEQAANDMNRVLPINVEVVAELARLEVPLSRLQGLAIGDTLDLGRLSDVVLRVRGEPTLRGEPGTIDGVRCVRVRSGKNLGGG